MASAGSMSLTCLLVVEKQKTVEPRFMIHIDRSNNVCLCHSFSENELPNLVLPKTSITITSFKSESETSKSVLETSLKRGHQLFNREFRQILLRLEHKILATFVKVGL